jgi:hypothetical protein
MNTPMVPIQILSIYKSGAGERLFLPARMAVCAPDMHAAILGVKADVEAAGGVFFLSDLFRSYDMQFQAHLDFTSGKKASFSPAPGGSMHEAGRAFDMDLGSLNIPLAKFWTLAAARGLTPIIKEANTALKEAWHFDCRGSHGKVYDYYTAGKGTNFQPYQAMAASAILSAGLRHDAFTGHEKEACVQSLLIRLGYDIGNIDGQLGMKSNAALAKAGIPGGNLDAALTALQNLAQTAFPDEFRSPQIPVNGAPVPSHVIS